MLSVPLQSLTTDRLLLRPTRSADARRAFDIRSDWEVSRMLSVPAFPPCLSMLEEWFAGHEREWYQGEAYRFAIEYDRQMIGVIDLDHVTTTDAELGYWLDRSSWGRGYAGEAVQAVVRFAFDELELSTIKAGRAGDNAASGRVLERAGFVMVGVVERFSRPRAVSIASYRYVLENPTGKERGRGKACQPARQRC